MDPVGALIRVSRRFSPPLAARIDWTRERRLGNSTLRVLETVVRRGDHVVDVGANWGYYTWQLIRLVGPRGRVDIVEPNPEMLRYLRGIRGGRPNVTIHPLALSDQAGKAELHIPLLDGHQFSELGSMAVPRERAGIAHRTIAVRRERLDTLLGSADVDFVKCDVEGHELAVLRGAEAVLRRSRPALLIEIEQRHQSQGDIRQTFAHLARRADLGYSINEDGLRPIEEFDLEQDQLAFLGPRFMPYAMPPGYVHDFLFVGSGHVVAPLLARRQGGR
jgi:FkbM family methyltransferase